MTKTRKNWISKIVFWFLNGEISEAELERFWVMK